MPIPVCKFGRAYFSKLFKDISTYGYCASKKETYFGLKLHEVLGLYKPSIFIISKYNHIKIENQIQFLYKQ